MPPTDASIDSAPGGTPAAEPPSVAEEISLKDLAADTGAYARAWGGLFLSEASLAKSNLLKLLILALMVPAVALSALICLDALLATVLHGLGGNWMLASGVVFLLNALGLLGMFWLLRGWWQTLTLPRTRAALSRLMEGLQ